MSESKHTPGPWLRQGLTVYALDERKNTNRFSFHVEQGYLHRTRYEQMRTPYEEIEATAILAHAAPDLLEAVKDAERLIAGDLGGIEWKRACGDFLVMSRAAIAKAEGRS